MGRLTNNPEFEKFYRAFRPRLVNYTSRYVDSYEQACDIVQDAFYKVLVSYPDFDPEKGASLLYTITRNACIDHLKRKKIVMGADLS